MKKRLRNLWLLFLILVLTGTTGVFAAGEETVETTAVSTPLGVSYRTHVENYGNMPKPEGTLVAGPEAIGTRGQGLRVEGFWIELTGEVPENAGISYQVHVQNKGWMDAMSDGSFAGTTGKGLRIESIRISLNNLDDYDVYYRGHVQNRGDLPQIDGEWGWVKNGQDLGSTGSSLRLEELQIKLVRRDTNLTAYNELLETIGKLSESDYTPESWATLTSVIAENTVTEASLQADVDTAVSIIQTTYEALALKVVAVYDTPGIYGPETGSETIDGSVVIAVSGVTLQNLVIAGDLTIAEAVGDGDASLNNLTVVGKTNIYGGGTGATTQTAGTLTVQNGGGGIVINGGQYSEIQIIKNAGSIQIFTFDVEIGEYLLIKEVPENEEVILEGHFSKVSVAYGENINLRINEGSRVDVLYAGMIELDESIGGGIFEESASGLTVRGTGSIGTLGINSGTNNVTVGVNVDHAYILGDDASFTGTVAKTTNNGVNTRFKTEPGIVEGIQPVIDPTLESPNGEPEPPTPIEPTPGGTSTQATPTFDPASGAVVFGSTVTISSASAEHIYYTTDGSVPISGVNGSTLEYTAPVTIDAAKTIKAIAVKTGSNNSAVATATYTQAAPSYGITIGAVTGGSATVTTSPVTAAAEGDSVTVNISNIESGKQFKSITVTDADSGTVSTTAVSAGSSYSFTMPAKTVTVVVAVESVPTYGITIGAVTGGSATVTTSPVTAAAEGDSVTVNISNIESGKQFKSITATDADSGTVSTTAVSVGSSYSFTMPAKTVTVVIAVEAVPTYGITIDDVVGGSATVSTSPETAAAEGASVSVDISNIESGKQFKSITVTDADSGTVSTTAVSAGSSYSFTMPAKTVTVVVAVEAVPTYGITIDAVVGGSATVSTSPETAAAEGDSVTVNISNIESGKQFKSITVTDADSGTVSTTAVSAGSSYSFTMPAKTVTVVVAVEAVPTYGITIDAVVGGSATVSTSPETAAAEGASVSVDISNIESGKQFKSITVTDADSGTVSTTAVSAGSSYSFTMPAKTVTVTVEVEASSAPAPGSITSAAWATNNSVDYYLILNLQAVDASSTFDLSKFYYANGSDMPHQLSQQAPPYNEEPAIIGFWQANNATPDAGAYYFDSASQKLYIYLSYNDFGSVAGINDFIVDGHFSNPDLFSAQSGWCNLSGANASAVTDVSVTVTP
ncbi:chitobiase/beta-hexosaminidase C-terminal domain-containing protein [Acetobacterium carbinolicum]|uniref:chitobiase/beta-hexosaminidase C-terminal domain-containing protein n=1 Tax=Acetobacterium carbinolicum TaxID=52690 RepID=UPI003BF55CC9